MVDCGTFLVYCAIERGFLKLRMWTDWDMDLDNTLDYKGN